MISIQKAYFSYDLTEIFIHFSSSDVVVDPLSDLYKLELIKNVNGVESIFPISIKEMDGARTNEIYAINLEEDIDPELGVFSPSGIMEIQATFGANVISIYFTAGDEFYNMKAKMMSVNCDNSNVSKMSKKLATFAFLERMMLSALDNRFIDDARLFYAEMVRLSAFGHSNIDQKNPNCAY